MLSALNKPLIFPLLRAEGIAEEECKNQKTERALGFYPLDMTQPI